MATLTINNSNILFRKYNKEALVTVNQEAKFYNIARKESWEGELIEGRLMTAMPTSVGNASGDGAAYPVADYARHVSYQIGRRFYHGSAEITLGILAAAKGGAQSVRSASDLAVRELLNAAIKEHNILFYGDGTGRLASLASALGAADTTMSVRGRYNATARSHAHPYAGIWNNGTYEVRDESASYANLGSLSVTNRSPLSSPSGNVTFNITAPGFTADAGDVLVKPNTYGVAFSGLHKLIDNDVSGTFQGITMSGARDYVSVVMSNSNTLRDLSPQLLTQLAQGIMERSGQQLSGRAMCLVHPAQIRQFALMYEPDMRIAASDSVVGNKATVFQSALGEMELNLDTDCPPTDLFLVDRNELVFYEQRPLGFVQDGGEVWTPSRSASVMNANLYEVGELAIKDRRKCGKITDLNYSLVA